MNVADARRPTDRFTRVIMFIDLRSCLPLALAPAPNWVAHRNCQFRPSAAEDCRRKARERRQPKTAPACVEPEGTCLRAPEMADSQRRSTAGQTPYSA